MIIENSSLYIAKPIMIVIGKEKENSVMMGISINIKIGDTSTSLVPGFANEGRQTLMSYF